jgi:hypothetical protein
MNRPWFAGFAACAIMAGLAAAGRADEPAAAPKVPDRATLERQFEQTMSGATLVGFFTTEGAETKQGLKPERYTISKVAKASGDHWTFFVRIQYGEHDATLPLALEVQWAGDTPVITLTDLLIPGFGTFTARVLVYRDRYAGYWSGGDHGGQLFGRVTREPPADEPPAPKAKSS